MNRFRNPKLKKKKKEQLCVLRGPRSIGTSRETPWPLWRISWRRVDLHLHPIGLAWLGLAHLFFPLAVLTDCIRPGCPPRWRHLSRHSIPRAVNVSVTVWLHHESKPNPSSPVNGVWKVKVSTFRKKWPFSPDRKIKFQITKAKEKPTKQVKKVKKNVFFSYDFHLCMPRQHCQEIYSNF